MNKPVIECTNKSATQWLPITHRYNSAELGQYKLLQLLCYIQRWVNSEILSFVDRKIGWLIDWLIYFNRCLNLFQSIQKSGTLELNVFVSTWNFNFYLVPFLHPWVAPWKGLSAKYSSLPDQVLSPECLLKLIELALRLPRDTSYSYQNRNILEMWKKIIWMTSHSEKWRALLSIIAILHE